jgi:formylglycine-generating enzyme required for sulfatase activity
MAPLPSHGLFAPEPPGPLARRQRVVAASAIAASSFFALGAIVFFSMQIRGRASAVKSAGAPSITAASPPRPKCDSGMIEVAGGKFFMGSDDDLDLEKPAHHVTLAPYCIDQYEVTVAQYKACSDRGDCKRAAIENKWEGMTKQDAKTYDPLCNVREPMARAQHPINCIDWEMAAGYCASRGGRLPTEAEWEFAARGPDGRKYPWGDEEPGALELNACGKECLAWAKKNHVELEAMYDEDDGWANTAPVGSFPGGKSRYGLYDVMGNVWEWTSDHYAPYTAEAQVDPKGPTTGDERVIRGGAWNGAYTSWVRPTFRYKNAPETRSYGIGFRCAKSM